MIFSKSADEIEKKLYFKNTYNTRKNFIFNIEVTIKEELESCVKSQKDNDKIRFYEQIYKETNQNLCTMKDTFIETGHVTISSYVFLTIEERFIL